MNRRLCCTEFTEFMWADSQWFPLQSPGSRYKYYPYWLMPPVFSLPYIIFCNCTAVPFACCMAIYQSNEEQKTEDKGEWLKPDGED